MSKHSIKLSLKEMYAIKHSLALNIKYKDLSLIGAIGAEKEQFEKDIVFETKLKEKVENEIKNFKKSFKST